MEALRRKRSAKRVKSSPSSSCAIPDLPNAVLMEILSRVPIKTLTASKSVCKSWLNLITDPHFHRLHQPRAPIEVFFQPSHDEKDNTMKLHLGNFNFSDHLLPCYFEFPKSSVKHYQHVRKKLLFANSCNGLICYYGWSDVNRFALVWNPCTSEFITFPPPELDEGLPTCRGYGLGFSTKANKFKLLRLMGGRSRIDDNMVVADICTIEKACSWKRIGPCSSHAWFRDHRSSQMDLHAVFFRGALHWIGADVHKTYIALHTFDFEDDRFGRVPLPHSIKWYLHPSHWDNLGVLGGCLFIAEHHRNRSVTVWLMKEYGVEDSWTKLFCLGTTEDEGLQMRCSHCLPLIYMDNGEILMKRTISWTSTIIVYNPVLKTARVLGSCPGNFRAIAYSPSIVMLKDSMLGYYVQAIPRCQAVGLKQGKMSSALDWWKPVKKLAEEHCSGSFSSSRQTRLLDHERDQSEWYENLISEERKIHVSVSSESLASEESSPNASDSEPTSVSEGWERRLCHMNKMSPPKVSLMLEMKKLKQRDKELEHRDKELELQDRILDQREKLLNTLRELDKTDQSRMTSSELDRHLSKIKWYENLVDRTFDQ